MGGVSKSWTLGVGLVAIYFVELFSFVASIFTNQLEISLISYALTFTIHQ